MSKNFIQKFSRIIEKHVEKFIEIELIEISNHDSIVIVDVSIEFRIIITILQKKILLRKTMISCCSFSIDKAKSDCSKGRNVSTSSTKRTNNWKKRNVIFTNFRRDE